MPATRNPDAPRPFTQATVSSPRYSRNRVRVLYEHFSYAFCVRKRDLAVDGYGPDERCDAFFMLVCLETALSNALQSARFFFQ